MAKKAKKKAAKKRATRRTPRAITTKPIKRARAKLDKLDEKTLDMIDRTADMVQRSISWKELAWERQPCG